MTTDEQAMVKNLIPIIEAGLDAPATQDQRAAARAAWHLLRRILNGAHTAGSHARRPRVKAAAAASEETP